MSLAWGGFANGRIPRHMLMPVGGGNMLRSDAALSYLRIVALRKRLGVQTGITDGYRSYEGQEAIRKEKGATVATAKPGTSKHGYALAADLPNIDDLRVWMQRNAQPYGWLWPMWARSRNTKYWEPWHFEYYTGLDRHKADVAQPAVERDTEVIRRGDKGDYVRSVQRLVNGALARSGWDGPLLQGDGEWGDRSAELWNHARMRAQASGRFDFPDSPYEPNPVTIAMLMAFVKELK